MTTKTEEQQRAELLPCPCCGGDAAYNKTRTTCRDTIKLNGRDTGYGVNCVVCGLNNRGFVLGHVTETGAAQAWNRRAALQSQDREDALIEIILEACDEWSGYVEVDNAPRTLREHIKLAIDHARRIEGSKDD